ncbi:nickel transporter permease [Alkalihalobacillus sp. BA299]|uniref:nickel transporter permease n=1 Tax=Alkalihalobacillus sp. BA299 TaxID=2815938 RepID=UPI001AD97DBC|nr:nickel transporter permease [Alkalihalobacillus sp. BA299]
MKKARQLNKGLTVGVGIFVLFLLLGLFAKWLTPHDPLMINLEHRLNPPSMDYWFGTDHLGRCIFSRILYGIQTTVSSAIFIMAFTLLISLPIGLTAGYWRGRTDHFFMRIVDGTLALPDVIVTIAIVGILGPGFVNMLVAIVLVRWANYVRFIRSLVLKVGNEDFILSARMSGNSHIRIIKRYILPQIMTPTLVFVALDLGRIVLLMAGLSFLGLGVQPPTPEWGVMLYDATSYFQIAPHIMIFPGLAIMFFVLSCQLMSERLKKLA